MIKRINVWLRLLRVPNLCTIPGDVLVGFALAGGDWSNPYTLAVACGIALMAYAAGLLLNDFYDREKDAIERPHRPIPSGAANPAVVCASGVVLFAACLLAAFLTGKDYLLYATGVLCLFVLAYDAGGKKDRIFGSYLMGGCRALSLMLGAACGVSMLKDLSLLFWTALALWWVYIAFVTYIAAEETSGKAPGKVAFMPAALIVIAAAVVFGSILSAENISPYAIGGVAVLAVAAVRVAFAAKAVNAGNFPTPPFIGILIRHLLFLQAGFIMLVVSGRGAGLVVAGALLMWLCAVRLSKWFYAS